MPKLSLAVTAAVMALGSLAIGTYAFANDNNRSGANNQRVMVFADTLNGYQETAIGSISTAAVGTFEARLDDETQTITYTLTYEGIEGGPVTQAHIHFGSRSTNGGISAFLCPKAGATPPVCPPVAGTVTGVITAADVIGPTAQGIEPGSMPELMRAIRAGHTYVNVHSTRWGGGEIRGQLADRDQRQVQ